MKSHSLFVCYSPPNFPFPFREVFFLCEERICKLWFAILCWFWMGLPWWLRWLESTRIARDLDSVPELGRSPGTEDDFPLQCFAWRILWIEKPVGLQFMGSQRVRHDWATNTHTHTQILNASIFAGEISVSLFQVNTLIPSQLWSLTNSIPEPFCFFHLLAIISFKFTFLLITCVYHL